MRNFLKSKIGVAVAASLAIGLSSSAYAATDANALGDLAIVPYYTVMDNYVTGVHIINTTALTQVVKFRLRRDSDSADVLDFNIIMSPNDEWTGFVNDAGGNLQVGTNDTTCTAPTNSGSIVAPAINRTGAEEGYIEIIGMGETNAFNQIAIDALHADGVPADCDDAAENFLAANVLGNNFTTDNAGFGSFYSATQDSALKVSYFIRDTTTGVEFGDNAQHINTGAAYGPYLTNQQTGLNSGDTSGFDFPDLDGGGNNGSVRGMYDAVIRPDLAANELINDWSYNTTNRVMTDWVVTVPGQYLMVNPAGTPANNRDLPLTAAITVYDREEGEQTPGGLVVSPSPAPDAVLFTEEVNVVEWGGQEVFNTANAVEVVPSMDSQVGWASLALTSNTNTPLIFDLWDASGATNAAPVNVAPPVLGFAAWKRQMDDVNKNYGRIVAHSRK